MNLPVSIHYGEENEATQVQTVAPSIDNRINLNAVTLYIYADQFIVQKGLGLGGSQRESYWTEIADSNPQGNGSYLAAREE